MGMTDPKPKVTISIDGELLKRIDAVADARGEGRSTVIERMCFTDIGNEEKFLDKVESPVFRLIVETLTRNPVVLRTIASAIGENMSEEDAKGLMDRAQKQIKRAKDRTASRKQKGRRQIEGA